VTTEPILDLDRMGGCFDGVIPPIIATCSAAGEPNITHVSQIALVDGDHVAVSNQFFSKTTANLAENPQASALVTDSQTYDTFRLDLAFLGTRTEGPAFEAMRTRIEAIAAMMHMEHVFSLRGVDLYRVGRCTPISGPGAGA
jgi:adenylate cyclase